MLAARVASPRAPPITESIGRDLTPRTRSKELMPKWKKDAKEFTVAVHHNNDSGYYTTSIPKPIIEHLGKGGKVEAITYSIKGKRVEIEKNLKS